MNPVECSPIPLALGITESRKNISTDSIRQSPKKERERETPCAGCGRHIGRRKRAKLHLLGLQSAWGLTHSSSEQFCEGTIVISIFKLPKATQQGRVNN